MNTMKTTTRPFLGSDRVPPTSGRQTSVFLLFDSEQKTNTKETTPRPFLGSDRVPPTAGGQTDKCCTFLNHMEMHACAHAYAHAHVHTYIFTPTSTHEMRTHARAQTLPAPIRKRNCFFDANLGKMPGRIRKRPQRPKSSFEQLRT